MQTLTHPVQFEVDIPYTSSNSQYQSLDLLRPAHPEGRPLPLIVFLHGGAWSQGDKADGGRNLGKLVRSGHYVAAAVNYRLTNEAQWPAQLHDCKAAIRWLRAHASRYGIDSEHIAVWGRGAGAHLALMLGATANKPEFAGPLGQYHNYSTIISAVVNFAGIVDLTTLPHQVSGRDHSSPGSPEARLIGGAIYGFRHSAEEASPFHHLTPRMPPVLSIHSVDDDIIPYAQAEQLHQKLNALGVKNMLIPVHGARHEDFPDEALDRVAGFLDCELAGSAEALDPSPLSWQP